MSVNADRLGASGAGVADAGHMAERAAHVVGPGSSTFGRIFAAVSIVRLGVRLLPTGRRLVRRHPVASLLVAAGLLGALYLAREPDSPRLRLR